MGAQLAHSGNKKPVTPSGFANGETRTRTGDTTISVMRPEASNSRETLARKRILPVTRNATEGRELRSFPVDSGDE
jgi:hypothetical protein